MELILFIYLKTKAYEKNWKNVLLYIVRIIELLITGAAGGALGSGFMRTVSLIIVHCSANKAGSALRAEDIDRTPSFIGLEVLWLPLCDSYNRRKR